MSKEQKALDVKTFARAIVVQFNRPEIRSPLSIFVLEELRGILNALSENKSIKQIIFTGKADVFASGADLREIAAVNKARNN